MKLPLNSPSRLPGPSGSQLEKVHGKSEERYIIIDRGPVYRETDQFSKRLDRRPSHKPFSAGLHLETASTVVNFHIPNIAFGREHRQQGTSWIHALKPCSKWLK